MWKGRRHEDKLGQAERFSYFRRETSRPSRLSPSFPRKRQNPHPNVAKSE